VTPLEAISFYEQLGKSIVAKVETGTDFMDGTDGDSPYRSCLWLDDAEVKAIRAFIGAKS
jgi:hypothetical protein